MSGWPGLVPVGWTCGVWFNKLCWRLWYATAVCAYEAVSSPTCAAPGFYPRQRQHKRGSWCHVGLVPVVMTCGVVCWEAAVVCDCHVCL
jgi:hypothetical protein